jgi:Ca2+-binding RTX toxin-like protein
LASYIFETMAAADGDAFTTSDSLLIEATTPALLQVSDNVAAVGTQNAIETITLTAGAHGTSFSADQLSGASLGGRITFFNGDDLLVGTSEDNRLDAGAVGLAVGRGVLLYGFEGKDTIYGSVAHDTIDGGAGDDQIWGSSNSLDAGGRVMEHDFLSGGDGNDLVSGGAGNDHIYGNSFGSLARAVDGNDTLNGNGGDDYIQGNAGNDSISGGPGNDRLYGGAGNDTIVGNDGDDYIQGNKGDDVLSSHSGNDTIHGGQGNDTISGYEGDTRLFGDDGDDSIFSGLGHTVLTGGPGADKFVFQDDAGTILFAGHLIDQIMDFTGGEDKIMLMDLLRADVPVDHVYHQEVGLTFTSVAAAQTYAEQLMDAGTFPHEMAAIQVGTDTYLFYNYLNHDVTGVDAVHSINSAIELVGVAAASISTADFV